MSSRIARITLTRPHADDLADVLSARVAAALAIEVASDETIRSVGQAFASVLPDFDHDAFAQAVADRVGLAAVVEATAIARVAADGHLSAGD